MILHYILERTKLIEGNFLKKHIFTEMSVALLTPAGRKLSEPPCSSMVAGCEKVKICHQSLSVWISQIRYWRGQETKEIQA